jgi:hypothetical protein
VPPPLARGPSLVEVGATPVLDIQVSPPAVDAVAAPTLKVAVPPGVSVRFVTLAYAPPPPPPHPLLPPGAVLEPPAPRTSIVLAELSQSEGTLHGELSPTLRNITVAKGYQSSVTVEAVVS